MHFFLHSGYTDNESPLSCAARLCLGDNTASQLEISKALLDAGASPNRELAECLSDYSTDNYPLAHAIKNHQHTLTDMLLTHGANPSASCCYEDDEYGYYLEATMLSKACERHNAHAVECLLAAGVNANERSDGMTPLHRLLTVTDGVRTERPVGHEAWKRALWILNALLKKGADPNANGPEFGQTVALSILTFFAYDIAYAIHVRQPLNDAAIRSVRECARPFWRLLLEHGARLESVPTRCNRVDADDGESTSDGICPPSVAHCAVLLRDAELLATYVAQGGQLNLHDEEGHWDTPLYLAYSNGATDMMKQLLHSGCCLHALNGTNQRSDPDFNRSVYIMSGKFYDTKAHRNKHF